MTIENIYKFIVIALLGYLIYMVSFSSKDTSTIEALKNDNKSISLKLDSVSCAINEQVEKIKINNTKITNIRNSYITDTTYVQSITNNDSLFDYVQYQIDMLGKPRYY